MSILNKIEDAVADLYSTYENSEQAEGEEVEYKSRDGLSLLLMADIVQDGLNIVMH